jgi:hypothetical protein
VIPDIINRIAPPTDIKIPEGIKISPTCDTFDRLEFEYNELSQKIELKIMTIFQPN